MTPPTIPRDTSGCRQVAGIFAPVVDSNRCEGKGRCIDACPQQVFTMGRLDEAARRQLSWRGRLKAFAHGHRQAIVTSPDACQACGDCIAVCPEDAIRLQRREEPPPKP